MNVTITIADRTMTDSDRKAAAADGLRVNQGIVTVFVEGPLEACYLFAKRFEGRES